MIFRLKHCVSPPFCGDVMAYSWLEGHSMIWVCPELLDLSPRPRPCFSQTKTGDNFNPPFFQISHPFRLETSGMVQDWVPKNYPPVNVNKKQMGKIHHFS